MTRLRSTGGASKTKSDTRAARVRITSAGRKAAKIKASLGTKQKKTASQKLAEALRKRAKGKMAGSPGTAKFVLVYKGLEDPDPKYVERVMKELAPASVTEVLPGTLSVEGDGARIARRAQKLDSWSLSTEGVLSMPSPARTRFASPS